MAHVKIAITRDDLRPALARLVKLGRDPTPVLKAMGTTFLSITMGNFKAANGDYRPLTWKPKYGGAPATLQKSGTLSRAFHLSVSRTLATVANPMPYAAIHQFGGTIQPKTKKFLAWMGADGVKLVRKSVTIPPRPFYPVLNGALTPKASDLIAAAGMRAVNRSAGGSSVA
jgi:phage gpG-like protein